MFLLDIDECYDYPCENGAICIDLVNEYFCECIIGYDGPNCEYCKCVSSSNYLH